MIAHSDEITETEICIAQIPKILDERFRDPVVARLEQLTGGQISEAESPKRRNEIRGHAVVTQLLELVDGRTLVSLLAHLVEHRVADVVHRQPVLLLGRRPRITARSKLLRES